MITLEKEHEIALLLLVKLRENRLHLADGRTRGEVEDLLIEVPLGVSELEEVVLDPIHFFSYFFVQVGIQRP